MIKSSIKCCKHVESKQIPSCKYENNGNTYLIGLVYELDLIKYVKDLAHIRCSINLKN